MEKKGLYGKYIIGKSDGTPIDPQANYFVLRLDTDAKARLAAMYYAELTQNIELLRDLERLHRELGWNTV